MVLQESFCIPLWIARNKMDNEPYNVKVLFLGRAGSIGWHLRVIPHLSRVLIMSQKAEFRFMNVSYLMP